MFAVAGLEFRVLFAILGLFFDVRWDLFVFCFLRR